MDNVVNCCLNKVSYIVRLYLQNSAHKDDKLHIKYNWFAALSIHKFLYTEQK